MIQSDDSSTQVAVVTTNTGSDTTTTDWNFGSTNSAQYSVEVYRTSATENFAQLSDVTLPTSGVLQYGLPSNSITTFHLTLLPDSGTATAG